MTSNSEQMLKTDMLNLKDGEFRQLSVSETYGKGLKFLFFYTLVITVVHLFLLYITSKTGRYPMSIMLKQLPYYIGANLFAGIIISVMSMNYILCYCYFKNTFKSRKLVISLIKKSVIFYIVTISIFDFYQINYSVWSNNDYYQLVFFSFIPSFIITSFFINFEISRLSLGPFIDLIAEKISALTESEI